VREISKLSHFTKKIKNKNKRAFFQSINMKFTSLISASVLVFGTATLAVPHNILSAKDMLLGKRAEHGK
jgi:hypothetical protein